MANVFCENCGYELWQHAKASKGCPYSDSIWSVPAPPSSVKGACDPSYHGGFKKLDHVEPHAKTEQCWHWEAEVGADTEHGMSSQELAGKFGAYFKPAAPEEAGVEVERQEFESWCREEGFYKMYVVQWQNGRYNHGFVQFAWRGWQAARASK